MRHKSFGTNSRDQSLLLLLRWDHREKYPWSRSLAREIPVFCPGVNDKFSKHCRGDGYEAQERARNVRGLRRQVSFLRMQRFPQHSKLFIVAAEKATCCFVCSPHQFDHTWLAMILLQKICQCLSLRRRDRLHWWLEHVLYYCWINAFDLFQYAYLAPISREWSTKVKNYFDLDLLKTTTTYSKCKVHVCLRMSSYLTSQNRSRLIVKNLPAYVDDTQLRKHFTQASNSSALKLGQPSKWAVSSSISDNM